MRKGALVERTRAAAACAAGHVTIAKKESNNKQGSGSTRLPEGEDQRGHCCRDDVSEIVVAAASSKAVGVSSCRLITALAGLAPG